MKYPVTFAAKFQQMPYRFIWNEMWFIRYFTYSLVIMVPVYAKISTILSGEANTSFWREKRKNDYAHHHHEMEKKWEIRT